MTLVDFALSFLAGLWLAALERLLAVWWGAAPDLAAVTLALLLVGSLRRSTGLRAIGVLLGFSTWSLAPVGAWLLGGGIAAAILIPLREIVFTESRGTQALFGLLTAGALASARVLYALFGAQTLADGRIPRHFTAAELVSPLLTAATVPILRLVLESAERGNRRLHEWWAARGEEREASPPG